MPSGSSSPYKVVITFDAETTIVRSKKLQRLLFHGDLFRVIVTAIAMEANQLVLG